MFHFTSERRIDDGIIERNLMTGGVPGTLWTSTNTSHETPVILIGHPGGLERLHPRVAARARDVVQRGFAAVTIELPGGGTRGRLPGVEAARADLQNAIAAGEPVTDDIVRRLVLPLVDQGSDEWRAVLDDLATHAGLTGPAGISGGVIGIGIRVARVEPRVKAAGLFAGSFVPKSILEDEAPAVTIPVHMLLQWDDEWNDRQLALDLFDAFASTEKTLQANLGGHTGVPAHAGEDAARFFQRHLPTSGG